MRLLRTRFVDFLALIYQKYLYFFNHGDITAL